MSGSAPTRARRKRGRRWVIPVVVVAFMTLILAGTAMNFLVDLLWFRSVGLSSVLTSRARLQVLLFVGFGLITGGAVAVNLILAYRLRPPVRPISVEQQNLERYRVAVGPFRRVIVVGIAALVGIMAGSSAADHWRTFLMWRNGTQFGVDDPQFGRDVSYYAFTYPFQRWMLGALFTVVVVSLLAAAVTHYLYGGVRVQTPGPKLSPGARGHLAVLLGLFMLLKAIAYWLDRYGLTFSGRGVVTGASYTDVNAVLPAKLILTVIALFCAVLFFATLFTRGWLLPVVGLGLLAFSALVIGGIYPAVIQQFVVKPSEADKEGPYIQRNIEATRQAYGIEPGKQVADAPYPGTTSTPPSTMRADQGTLPFIRLLDPTLISPTFQSLQGFRSYYRFSDALDVDRYTLAGKQNEVVVGVRDINLDGLSPGQNNWINRHLVYTHGYGMVVAPGNQVDSKGQPVFIERDMPTQGPIKLTQPRVYFGEGSPVYSVVGDPSAEAGQGREIDYPTDAAGGQVTTTYAGRGGVDMGTAARRALFALYFREKNLFLSSGVNDSSKILYVRHPRDRVQKVAPWLTLDGDPYPAIVGERVVWIVDGFTTTDGFPYSERFTLNQLTTDTNTVTAENVVAQRQNRINYVRNSVKAVVDAYDGTVTLYQWGPRDPVLETWRKAFPGTVQPESQIPPELRSHLRYPEDLFKVQRRLYSRYHVSDPRSFYNGTDFWRVPTDPTKRVADTDQPPYYLTLTLPGEQRPAFQVTSTLVANQRPNMTAYISANSDPTSELYGKLTVLRLPTNTNALGPGQVANAFESDPRAASQLTLLRGGGSRTEEANLLTLPLMGGLVYVEPIYVRASGATSFPTMQKVFAYYNGKVAFENTIAETLDSLFGSTPPSGGQTGGTPPVTGGTGGGGGPLTNDAKALLAEANDAYADGQAALRAGDFTAYGQAQARLKAALDRLTQLSTASPSPTSPSPRASP